VIFSNLTPTCTSLPPTAVFQAAAHSRWVALYYYSKIAPKGKSQIKELKPSVQTFPAYVGFSKANNLLSIRDQVDIILREMKEDGSHQKIIDAYVDSWGIDLD